MSCTCVNLPPLREGEGDVVSQFACVSISLLKVMNGWFYDEVFAELFLAR